MSKSPAALIALALIVGACRTENAEQYRPVQAGGPASSTFDPDTWRPPADSAIPDDSLGASIRRGLALFVHTNDSLPAYAPGSITCASCHLDAGRNVDAIPLTGSHVRYPTYLARSGAVVALTERVNYCFTRSLAGSKLPLDSQEMQDMLAYIAWLSRGVPVGAGHSLPGAAGLASMPAGLQGDATRGEAVYTRFCAACHHSSGEGNPALHPPAPALWGPRSFSVGASMAREGKAASFIWHNMPLGAGKTLTPQQAFDVAAYISSKPRLDSPGKQNDWPRGGAPADVPYATSGHVAYKPPARLLPRPNAAASIVPPPRRAATRAPLP